MEAVEAGRSEDALEHYRGDLLEGFFISDAPEFEKWLDAERAKLRRLAAQAAWTLADAEESAGREDAAAEWARRAAGYSLENEGVLRRLISLLDRVGDRPPPSEPTRSLRPGSVTSSEWIRRPRASS
jgi:serine/threonine-protein kinase